MPATGKPIPQLSPLKYHSKLYNLASYSVPINF
jgi:hypothetical protein